MSNQGAGSTNGIHVEHDSEPQLAKQMELPISFEMEVNLVNESEMKMPLAEPIEKVTKPNTELNIETIVIVSVT